MLHRIISPRLALSGFALVPLLSCAGGSTVSLLELEREKEANEVLVLLDHFGVRTATASSTTVNRAQRWRITLDRGEERAGRYILNKLGLPREDRGGLEAILDGGGLVPSRLNERTRLTHAKADKLARSLEAHDRVVTARVHIVYPDERQIAKVSRHDEPSRPTASIFLRYLAEEEPESPATDDLQAFNRALEANEIDAEAFWDVVERLRRSDLELLGQLADEVELPEALAAQLREAGVDDAPTFLAGLREVLPNLAALLVDVLEAGDPQRPIPRSSIVMLVANAIEGLDPWDVRVVWSPIGLSVPVFDVEGRFESCADERLAELLISARSAAIPARVSPVHLIATILSVLCLYLGYLYVQERRRAAAWRDEAETVALDAAE